MRKRILAGLLSLGLMLGAGLISPTHALACNNGHGWDEAASGGSSVTAAETQMTVGSFPPLGTYSDHWIGIPGPGNNLVQMGQGWLNGDSISFWYEFYPSPPVLISTQVLAKFGRTFTTIQGDNILYSLFYHNSSEWGFDFTDLSVAGWPTYGFYATAPGGAANYEGYSARTETETTGCENLTNDGVITVKQPQLYFSGAYHFFTGLDTGTGLHSNLYDPDGDGHNLETMTTTNSNAYAYMTWNAAT